MAKQELPAKDDHAIDVIVKLIEEREKSGFVVKDFGVPLGEILKEYVGTGEIVDSVQQFREISLYDVAYAVRVGRVRYKPQNTPAGRVYYLQLTET